MKWEWCPVVGGMWIKCGTKTIARFGEREWPNIKREVVRLFNAHNKALAKVKP